MIFLYSGEIYLLTYEKKGLKYLLCTGCREGLVVLERHDLHYSDRSGGEELLSFVISVKERVW